MSYVRGLDFVKRRESFEYLTPAEAILKANTIAAEADKVIAQWKGQADHYESIARSEAAEVARLRKRVAELEAEVKRLKEKPKPKPKAAARVRREDFEG